MQSESVVEITKALAKFQGAIPDVKRTNTNPFFKSKYADLSAIWNVVREPLSKNGLAVTQGGSYEDGHNFLETTLSHVSGEWIAYKLPITPGKPNDPQAVGSAITYARRYALSAILGIVSEDDDDAESAMDRKPQVVVPAKPAPKKPKDDSPLVAEAKKMGAVESIENAGQFLTKALKEYGLNKSQVEQTIGTKVSEIIDFNKSWEFLTKNVGESHEK